jgi:hypothetical protein
MLSEESVVVLRVTCLIVRPRGDDGRVPSLSSTDDAEPGEHQSDHDHDSRDPWEARRCAARRKQDNATRHHCDSCNNEPDTSGHASGWPGRSTRSFAIAPPSRSPSSHRPLLFFEPALHRIPDTEIARGAYQVLATGYRAVGTNWSQ